MSGPIVRKYGFPNFESIFGERPIQHGADADAVGPTPSAPESKPTAKAAPVEPAAKKPAEKR